MAYLSAKLFSLWDIEFYSRHTHAFFGFTWQICGALFDWSGTMVQRGLPDAACVLKSKLSAQDAE
eukprot:247842-Prymnesium_polylepis.1